MWKWKWKRGNWQQWQRPMRWRVRRRQMDENDPRSHAGRAGHRSERAMGSRKGRTRARIITADLRVMGTPTRSRPLARSVAAHVVAFLFDNGLTDEWGRGRCDLHACHLDHPSLARSVARPFKCQCQGASRRQGARKGLPKDAAAPPVRCPCLVSIPWIGHRSAILFARAPS